MDYKNITLNGLDENGNEKTFSLNDFKDCKTEFSWKKKRRSSQPSACPETNEMENMNFLDIFF